ncbi:MAG: hypothetical protein SNJ56_02235, partial [Termitinemataceae bacterium]
MKFVMSLFYAIMCCLASIACISCNFTFSPAANLSADAVVNLNLNDQAQTIEGFGGSNAWLSFPADPALKNELVRLLFSRTQGIGLTMLRNRIPFRELNKDGHDDQFINKDVNNNYIFTQNGTNKDFSLNWSNWDLQNTKQLVQLIKELPEGPENLICMS